MTSRSSRCKKPQGIAEGESSLGSEASIALIRAALLVSDDLRKKRWQGDENPYVGHCYVASEALYHLLGGRDAGLTPMSMKVAGITHWFLKTADGEILDPTASQFEEELDYPEARGRGFLTKGPSRRAKELLARIC